MQGGGTDIFESVILEVDRKYGYGAWTPFAWGLHDAFNFAVEANRQDYVAVVNDIVRIAEQERDIYGVKVKFPVSAEIIDSEGNHLKLPEAA